MRRVRITREEAMESSLHSDRGDFDTLKSTNSSSSFDEAEQKVIQRSVIIVSIFGLCWTPFYTVRIFGNVFQIEMESHGMEILIVSTLVIVYLNHALNPIVYDLISNF